MTFNTLDKRLVAILFSTLLVSACGGGGGGDSDSTSTNSPTPTDQEVVTPQVDEAEDEVVEDTVSDVVTAGPVLSTDEDVSVQPEEEVADSNVQPTVNNEPAAAIADSQFNLARTSCGLNSSSNDDALTQIAIKHTNYIKYVFTNTRPSVFNPHSEEEVSNIRDVTGTNNPFFGGFSFADRLENAEYRNRNFGVTENIAQSVYFNSVNNTTTTEVAARSLSKALLAAPYHLRSLMLPSSNLIGTSVVSYTPFDRDAKNYRGFVLVTHGAATRTTQNTTPAGILTYPCQDVSGTVTALYNESPDPVSGTGRNLRTDPIGQPIYINMPTANTIKVSNVSFKDVARNVTVPVSLLDYDQDPYENTIYELPKNEAFILPLTDNLSSCLRGSRIGQNCGLYGNSEYQVSFDVLVDNQRLESKSFTFKTGNVNY